MSELQFNDFEQKKPSFNCRSLTKTDDKQTGRKPSQQQIEKGNISRRIELINDLKSQGFSRFEINEMIENGDI